MCAPKVWDTKPLVGCSQRTPVEYNDGVRPYDIHQTTPMLSLLPKDHPILEKGMLEFPPFGLDAEGQQIRDVTGVTVLANITHLEQTFEQQQGKGSGTRVTTELCALLNARIKDPAYHVTPTFLKNTWNSYSYEFVCFMGEFCRILTNDPTFQYQVGQHYFIPSLIRILGRPFSV